jgi:mono/diheme cytochrome c family protein
VKRASAYLLAVILVAFSASSQASHNWGGIDVCTAYRGTAPPGIDPATLPEPQGRGAQLLQQYCVQCHALTGPGRHTAGEWPVVLERMRMLMDVSRRFRGLMGSIQMPDAEELRALGEYLTGHALQPMRGTPRGAGAQVFMTACAACHTLPDPRQYRAAEWPQLVAQMRDKADIMGRTDLNESLASDDMLAYLQRNAADRLIADPHGNVGVAPVSTTPSDERNPQYGLERLVWLTPFFAVIGLGLWRWWVRRQL